MKKLLIILSIIFLAIISNVSFALKPIKGYKQTPANWDLNFKEFTINTIDSFKLKSWYLTPIANRKNKTIIISNSDFGNMSYILQYGAALYDQGYDVVLYDYRGFGASSSFDIDVKKLFYTEFAEDLKSVHNFYQKKTANKQFVFMGLSMGTIITSIFLSENSMHNQLFVFDGFITSINSTVMSLKNLGKEVYAPISDTKYQPMIDSLQNNTGLIFNALNDKVCSVKKEDFENCAIVDINCGHLQSFYTLTEGEVTGNIYIKHIMDFINKGIKREQD